MPSLELFDYTEAGHIHHEEGHAICLVRLAGGNGPEITCHLFKSYIHDVGIPYEALSASGSRKTYMKHFDTYDERNHQVMQMASIYKEAERVIFWLGPSTIPMGILMNALECLQKAALKRGCNNWALEDERWREMWSYLALGNSLQREHLVGLKSALDSPWFRRIWILQECAHAKSGIVACVHHYVTAQIFALAPSLLQVSVGIHCQEVLDIMPGFYKNRLLKNQLDLFTLLLKFQRS